MKILVIGGTNFIGPVVVNSLVNMGHEVTVFHRGKTNADLPPTVGEIFGDRAQLTEFKTEFKRLSPEVVLDMIALTEQDALTASSAFEGIAQHMIAVSSIDVYRARDTLWGKESKIFPVPLTEDSVLRRQLYPYRGIPSPSPINSSDDYEKILVEKVVMANSELPGTILRLPMVYGYKDYMHRFFSYLKRMFDNRPAIVLEETFAQWHGSYGFVENVAYGITLAVTNPHAKGRIYNIAEQPSLTEAERIKKLGCILGWEGKVVVVPKSRLPEAWKPSFNMNQQWIVDTTRIRKELGYLEPVPEEEAFRQTIDWEKKHLSEQPQKEDDPWLFDYATEDAILTHVST
ncbi:MAG: NAD-dependent dehydratase [Scytonematopsis contorta HA4267-MV1]|jgi:nucleoside-diphosphate-sugar epimerase|nr:NAD-dependent dehydratase [Scytonematopsis contorta HA4267-MV1]